ncbi:MAG: DUF2461 domain-containing protein [Bacteroidota bacterium]
MVSKEYIFQFLRDLRNNNSKEWMDENRERYHRAKERWIQEVDLILKLLKKHDASFERIVPKSTLSRINNNRRFHPNKPIYKDYFTCDPSVEKSELSKLHISIGPSGSFIGAGLHHPSSETLKKFHSAIDYNGDRFKKILQGSKIDAFFESLSTSDKDLKTAPRGYDVEHKHVEILRRKSITLMRNLTEAEVCGENFPELIEEAYLTLLPFNNYLEKAISFEP